MTVWFTSDLHIGHRVVAAHRGYGYLNSDSPVGISAHDAHLAMNWDAVVRPDDTVWILGDLSAGGSNAQRNALKWISERPGVKHLIAGNHDGPSPRHRDSHKWIREYMTVFESVQQSARRRLLPIEQGVRGVEVVMSHYPYTEVTPHAEPDRFTQWWLRDEGVPILHGHVHSHEVVTYSAAGTPQIHVGLDAWRLSPVSLERLSELIG